MAEQLEDPFQRALDRAVGGRPVPGNRVRLLFDGPDTFQAMLDLIARAEHWIHLDSYIIRGDSIGQRFAKALIARAHAGVSVRVLTDWLGSLGTSHWYWRELRAAGVDVRLFAPPRFVDLAANLSRDHRKLLVIDGAMAITGGVCIGNEWLGDPARNRAPWRDTAVEMVGPAAAALDMAFLRVWGLAGGSLGPSEVAAEAAPAGTTPIRVIAGEPGQERAYRVTELLLALARERIWVTDAYFFAPKRIVQALVDAAREGVDVRLLVPSSSDLPLVRNLTRLGYRELLRGGVRIFEWGGAMLHSKTVVVDERWFRLGSSNLNHSSLVGNFEMDILGDDRAIANELDARFRRDIDRSTEVTLRPLRAPQRLGEVLPPVLAFTPRGPEPRSRRGMLERRRRALRTVGTVVAGTRWAVFTPFSLLFLALATLFFALPTFMAVVFGGLSVWLALAIVIHVRRRHIDDG